MAMWHVMMGMGIGLIATILTVFVNQRKHRAIPHNSKTNYFSPPGEQCPICLANMENDEMIYLNCGHAIHEHCLRDLRRYGDNKCPTCREKI
ncbi:probable E3 ubiquitin-protein ligase RHA1A [Lucilia cuprina]|uniref:probable E3 ubiquitin-protein ligase RHA1A n=1 Tax=Lucilia cuprina TaxID=7375 RepID=UPI001F05AFF5|nr:probable E3 ubiquitin-protein ligase RHA1A [Lucilia cuprina]